MPSLAPFNDKGKASGLISAVFNKFPKADHFQGISIIVSTFEIKLSSQP
jgi:hypothetical protein